MTTVLRFCGMLGIILITSKYSDTYTCGYISSFLVSVFLAHTRPEVTEESK